MKNVNRDLWIQFVNSQNNTNNIVLTFLIPENSVVGFFLVENNFEW